MKKFTNIKSIIITLGIISAFSILIKTDFRYHQGNNHYNLEFNNEPKLKSAGYWNIEPIEIDDDDPTKNWLVISATSDWCSGSGTWSDPYIIENVTIDGQQLSSCIEIRNSKVFFIIRNCTLYNITGNNAGIKLEYVDRGLIINNTCFNEKFIAGYGIYLVDSDINTIKENNIKKINCGISLHHYCDLNNITENIVYLNSVGIDIIRSHNNLISQNNINGENFGTRGIHIRDYAYYNKIKENIIVNYTEDGIYFDYYTDYNIISENKIINNTDHGIHCFRFGSNNDFQGNIIEKSDYGFYLDRVNYNNFIQNTITNNNVYGIYIDRGYNNLFYNNTLINNTISAYDYGIYNEWNYRSLGNYWDDYGGVDANDDGIGDTPYDVPPVGGSMDNFPKWRDSDDIGPNIKINSPSMNDAFGLNAPAFDITLNDQSLINSTWYTIDNGIMNYTFTELTGTINQTAWDNKGTEIITLRFYANDSLGHIGFKDVVIWKDLIAPKITINSPTPNQLCGIPAPTFNIQIIEPNLQEKRYSLNGRPNITFTTQTQFSQTEWHRIGNGTVSIVFYAIDKTGNVNSSEVIVRKDAYVPDVTIYSPLDDEKFGKTPPDYDISIFEEDLVSTWYRIEGIAGIFTFTGWNGTINQDAWDDAPGGEITLTFYALDRAGNIGSESVIVIKIIPSIPVIPGYNLFFLLGILSVVSIIISKKLKKS